MEHGRCALYQILWDQVKNRNFVWVGVSMDEDEATWREFVSNNRLGGMQLLSREWADAFGVMSYPTALLIDKTGLVRYEVGDAGTVMGLLSED